MRVPRGKFVWTLTVPSTHYSCTIDIRQYIFTLVANEVLHGWASCTQYVFECTIENKGVKGLER